LVNWTIINHAVKNLPHPRYGRVQPGCGIWAPALRFHAGKFWIFFAMPDEGIYVITATDPAGQWTEPHLAQAGKGLIDPCPLWDDDGQAYLVHAYAGSRAGIKHRLRVCPMAPDGTKLLGEGQIVFHEPTKHPTLEGPKFYKRAGWYYILAPAGGVETGWQVALRSRQVYGPYEDRIVLAQGGTAVNGPHQGALVDTPGGEWWFAHFQDAGLYGRVPHLQPVRWQDDWPLMGRNGEPVACHAKPNIAPAGIICAPATSDEFAMPRLGRQWQWNANHADEWYSLAARPGWLRLYSQPAADTLSLTPNLLLQKFPARRFTVETLLDTASLAGGEEAGLVIAGRASASLAVCACQGRNELRLVCGEAKRVIGPVLAGLIRLRVIVRDGGRCEFGYATAKDFVVLPDSFSATAGVWIGARVGVYAAQTGASGPHPTGGHADFDYFRFAPEIPA
jgi:beta-xylosidase